MGRQVTLTISDPIYDKAERIAQEKALDVVEVLAEFTAHGKNAFDEMIVDEDDSTILAEEEATFIRMHPKLWAKYPGEYVAILGDKLVDHDADLNALSERIDARFGNIPIWVSPVRKNPIEEWVFRSPRFVPEK
jgi:hypothetical protein